MPPSPPRPEWYDPKWYLQGYQRDTLHIDSDKLLENPVLAWEGQGYEGRERQNEPWRQLAGVVPHAQTLHCFTDGRWLPFEGKPLPDGSNIAIITEEDGTRRVNGSDELLCTYNLYRRWLEFLYSVSLLYLAVYRDPETNRFAIDVADDALITQTLEQDLVQAMDEIIEMEAERVIPIDDLFRQYYPGEGLNWIFLWRKSVVNQLHNMMAASNWAADTEANEELDAMMEEFGNFSYINQVLVAIVYKEASFESRLHVVHVEDEHVFKRIRLVETQTSAFIGRNALTRIHERYLERLLSNTRQFQDYLRELFSFRQLRDWGYGRPWRKMHLVFDIEVRPHLQEAVRRVRELVAATRTATNLFGVVPVEKSSLRGNCMVCLEDWLDHDLAIETHCHHYFHAACIMRYWDTEYQFDFRCPLCRTSGGRVRDRVTFHVRREDYTSDPQQAAVQQMTLEAAMGLMMENPELRTGDLPQDYLMAIGRQMELERLHTSHRLESDGTVVLPLP